MEIAFAVTEGVELMDELIRRQDAIDALKEHRNLFCDNTPDTFSVLPYGDKCRVDELDMAIATLINLPSAQPKLPDWAQKVEEYRKSAPSHIHNPLAWALYQVWKEYDERLVHQRGKEN